MLEDLKKALRELGFGQSPPVEKTLDELEADGHQFELYENTFYDETGKIAATGKLYKTPKEDKDDS